MGESEIKQIKQALIKQCLQLFNSEGLVEEQLHKTCNEKLYQNLTGNKNWGNYDGFLKQSIQSPGHQKKENSERNKTTKIWSESLNRIVTTIYLPKYNKELYSELITIGEELGVRIETLNPDDKYNNLGTPWFEDYGIRRHDGKILIVSSRSLENRHIVNYNEIYGRIPQQAMDQSGVDVIKNSNLAQDYISTDCYLEGGNVLNTINLQGEPAAVIGDDSIILTLGVLGLDNIPKNIKLVKNKIAHDLDLKPENVTYIPQHIFHIDMAYRAIGNGEIAIPDYECAISFIDDMLQNLPNTSINEEQIGKLKKYKEELIKMSNSSNEKLMLAEKELKESGYKIVKIPCFTTSDHSSTNHMNGIMGTAKNGTKFYITNKSDILDFDKLIEKNLKEYGINKIYFVDTHYSLIARGGIDCLTQEN